MKKLAAGLLVFGAAVVAIVYLRGVDEKTPLAPHRAVAFEGGTPLCPVKTCVLVDAGVELGPDEGDAGAVVLKGTSRTDCKVEQKPCPSPSCREATVVLDERAAEAGRLGDPAAPAAKGGYARVRHCGDEANGLDYPELPDGTSVLGDWKDVPFTTGYAALEIWLQLPAAASKSLAPADRAQLGCWCGLGCRDGKGKPPAGAHVVLSGTVTAPDAGDCTSVPCVALQGDPPDLSACCASECAGRACGEGLCGGSCGVCPDGQECVGYVCKPKVVEKPVEAEPR